MNSNHVAFFDTTLRDGEQSPGCSMTTQEKLTMAHALEDLGVDIIEAGFAMASEGDFAAIATITQAVRKPRIASLARAKTEDIEMAARALQFADRARIHVFLASSDLHLEYKLKISRAEALDLCGESVRLARSLVDDVEFSPEDATRSDRDFLVEMVRIAVEAGATTINMPDTVGYSTPEEYGRMFAEVRERIPAIDAQGIVLSSHCHDDLGLAVANSLAAIQNGARQVECTINGIGERAGNAALEEIAAALYVRGDRYGVSTSIKLDQTLPHQPGARPDHHLQALAQQGHRRRQRLRARVRHSPARHAGQPALLRDHDARPGRRGQNASRPRQALRPRRAAPSPRAARLRPHPRGAAADYYRFVALADRKKNIYDQDLSACCPTRSANAATTPSPNSIEAVALADSRFASGHDFSRAERSSKLKWALAPAVAFLISDL